MSVDYLYGFSEMYPDIQIRLRESPDEYPIDELLQDEFDIGLVMGPDEFENCEYELITMGEVVVVVSKDHPLAGKDRISIMELENEFLVVKSTRKGREHSFVGKCLEQGFTPNVMHEYGSTLTAHRLCELNGLVVVSINFIEEAFSNEKLKVIRLKEIMPQNIYLITRKNAFQSKAVSLFRSYVKERNRSL